MLRRRPAQVVASAAPPVRAASAITAAARRLDLTDRASLRKITRSRPLPWQKKAWDWYDELGEVRFAAGWIGDALSRLRIVPAWRDDPSQPPTILSDDTLTDVDGVTPEMLAQCQAAIARLDQGPGTAELMRLSGIQVTIPGEWYVIGRTDDERGEVWEVHAVDAVVTDEADTETRLKEYPDQPPSEQILLDRNSTVLIHLMRRHPRWMGLPDSPMRGALEYCEDLRILRDSVRGTALSRMNAGIFGVPKEATFGTGEQAEGTDESEADTPDGNGVGDPLTDALIEHMSTPIANPRSASAVVPFLLRLYGEDLEKVQKWDFSRDMDRLAIDLREEARRSIAGVMDLPAEIMLGMGDTNHWTAWQITEDAFRIHIEPLGQAILAGMTDGWYRAVLDAGEMDPDAVGKMLLWYDATDLVSKPDEAQQVQDAYDRVEVTGSYYRQSRGIPEDAVPDEEELERRKQLAEIKNAGKAPPPGSGPPADSGGMAPDTEEGVPATEGAPPPEIPEQVAASAAEPAPVVDLALVAAAKRDREWQRLATRFGRMEVGLMDRLRVSADELMNRGLEKAGNRLRSLANKDKAGLARRAVQSIPAHEVAASLGPAMVASLGATPDGLLQGAFDTLAPRFEEWTRAAQREAYRSVRKLSASQPRRLTAAASDDDEMPDEWEEDWLEWEDAHGLAVDRAEGWGVLAAGLSALAAGLLFGAHASPSKGEADSLYVPPKTVRDALRRAGGAEAPSSMLPMPGGQIDSANFAGLLSGESLGEMLGELAGRSFGGQYVWLYGDPSTRSRPFEPHEELDGVEFSSFTDDVLANIATWPDFDYYAPGDHEGCQCVVARYSEEGAAVLSSGFGWEDQERDEQGRFTSGGGGSAEGEATGGGGSLAERFAEGESGIVLPLDEVGTFIERLAEVSKNAEPGKRYNLCEVEVPGTNLFCGEHHGIPRQEMPQFKGAPGEKLGAVEVDKNGEVDVTAGFLDSLRDKGVELREETVPAYQLKATQSELRGEKVAGMTQAAIAGKFDPTGEAIVVSKDNYVVDGHHRWAAAVALDADDGRLGDSKDMPVIRVDMGILDLIKDANEYTTGRVGAKAG